MSDDDLLEAILDMNAYDQGPKGYVGIANVRAQIGITAPVREGGAALRPPAREGHGG